MIDWLTLKLPAAMVPAATREKLTREQSMIMQIDPTGEITWMRPCRREVRSDSHQITVELVGDLQIYGSPARVGLQRVDNVFGSSDIRECAQRILDFVASVESVELPSITHWQCTRIDVTHNYDLGSAANVRTALEMLRNVEGGRYQVRTAAESVYWSKNSTYRKGKAYAKGAHMRHLAKRGKAFLSDSEIEATDRLLRLELTLARHWIKRVAKKVWHQLTPADLDLEHARYFAGLVGAVIVNETKDFEQLLINAALGLGMSKAQGRAAANSWSVIRAEGYQVWRDRCPRTTFFRHKKILLAAGLSYADFAARNVVPIRQRRVILEAPVTTWAQLMAA